MNSIGVIGPQGGLGLETIPGVSGDIIFTPGAVAGLEEYSDMCLGGRQVIMVIRVWNLNEAFSQR